MQILYIMYWRYDKHSIDIKIKYGNKIHRILGKGVKNHRYLSEKRTRWDNMCIMIYVLASDFITSLDVPFEQSMTYMPSFWLPIPDWWFHVIWSFILEKEMEKDRVARSPSGALCKTFTKILLVFLLLIV